jgi:hypothetical protein
MYLDRSRPTPIQRAPSREIPRRYVLAGLAGLGAVMLLACVSLWPSSNRRADPTAGTGVVVLPAPPKASFPNSGPIREQAPSPPPISAPIPSDLSARVSRALGVPHADLHSVERSQLRADAYCGEIATIDQPDRRRFVLVEQPFLVAIDDGDQGFADVALLCRR